MKRVAIFGILGHPVTVALGIAALFALRFLDCLPFSGSTQVFNTESVAELTSFLIYAKEPFSFPLGSIKGLTFPFQDANVGNVGAIPLIAVAVKALGKLFPYFQTFDYVVLINLFSCFVVAFFSQLTLATLGVRHVAFRALGGLMTGTSFLLLTRSEWFQPFCVLSFPLFAAWTYAMVLAMQRGEFKILPSIATLSIFPLAALTDSYTLFALLLGTSALLIRETYEVCFGGLQSSRSRMYSIAFLCVGGVLLSVLALYTIGMFPLPPVPITFTSYDFGMGGRLHVADLFSPLLPVSNHIDKTFHEASLLGRLHFPFTTELLADGQSEGVGYIGTSALLLWCAIAAGWVLSVRGRAVDPFRQVVATRSKLLLISPWMKVGIAATVVFAFSLGYELHILGRAFPGFSAMPAAWISDRVPSVYNLRATGRLASLLSFFLILEAIRQLSVWCGRMQTASEGARSSTKAARYFPMGLVAALTLIHLVEIAPFLRPVPAQPTHPIGAVFSQAEVDRLERMGSGHDAVLISPGWRAGLKWETESFALAYYLGIRSNLYLVARTLPEHDARIARDLDRVIRGEWDPLVNEYGNRILFAIPLAQAEKLRIRMSDRFEETIVGPVSLWAKRQGKNQTEIHLREGS